MINYNYSCLIQFLYWVHNKMVLRYQNRYVGFYIVRVTGYTYSQFTSKFSFICNDPGVL